MLSALCRDIRHVRAEEFSDIRNYPTEMVVREVMLFGKDPETAKTSPMLDVLGHGFMQSIDMIAAELGLDARRREAVDARDGVATQDLDTPVGVHRRRHRRRAAVHVGGHGRRRAGDHRARELADGRGATSTRRGRSASSASRSSSTPIRRCRCTFHGLHPPVIGEHPEIGLTGPAMHCVNAIPYVVEAEPGIKTYLDLPLIAGRTSTQRLQAASKAR